MIRDTARGERRNPGIPAYSGKVFPEPRKQFVRNNVSTFLRAEHAMNEDVWIFVSHPTNVHNCMNPRLCGMSQPRRCRP